MAYRPSLSRWNPNRREGLDVILNYVVLKKTSRTPNQKPNKKVIQKGVTEKTMLVWNKAYVHRCLKFRFYEVFFIEYDKYACPRGKKEKERYIWRCIKEAALEAMEEFDRMVRD